jgi:hypothetical protein
VDPRDDEDDSESPRLVIPGDEVLTPVELAGAVVVLASAAVVQLRRCSGRRIAREQGAGVQAPSAEMAPVAGLQARARKMGSDGLDARRAPEDDLHRPISIE